MTTTPREGSGVGQGHSHPSVLISLLVRNKAHSLSLFLGYLERLNYPKSRITLLIRVDHCLDNSSRIMEIWVKRWRRHYSAVDYSVSKESQRFPGEGHLCNWTTDRYWNMIRLRQQALQTGRGLQMDYLFALDADVILLNPNTLHKLLIIPENGEAVVVAPLLNCTTADYFANFWGDMSTEGYYRRSDNYFDITYRHLIGLFPVAAVNSAVLIHLSDPRSAALTYEPPRAEYTGLIDEMVLFAQSARTANITLYVNNKEFFGYFPQPPESDSFVEELENFQHLKLQAIVDQSDSFRLKVSEALELFSDLHKKPNSKLYFDEIFVINLARRPDRKSKMSRCLEELGLKARYFPAIDGQELNMSFLAKREIQQMEGYTDPFYQRSLKFGEIGCFLSHYAIWEEILRRGLDRVLILEDDVRFLPGFLRRLRMTVLEANLHKPSWELIYAGRKQLVREAFVRPGGILVQALYSHWTIGYILNLRGAEKLVGQKPLEKMVAVDEYLPIMFNSHPRSDWLMGFEPRNLVALAAYPPLLKPVKFLGHPNYYSDTELSAVIPD